eukprot:4316028-Amphidinium_carterae.1
MPLCRVLVRLDVLSPLTPLESAAERRPSCILLSHRLVPGLMMVQHAEAQDTRQLFCVAGCFDASCGTHDVMNLSERSCSRLRVKG